MTNLATLLTTSAAQYTSDPAIILDELHMSYGQLDELSARGAALLKANGIRPGDRVALVLPNVPHMAVLYYAILRAGGIVVPLNPLLTPRELSYHFQDSGCSFVLAWEDMAEASQKAAEEIEGLNVLPISARGTVERLQGVDPDRDVVERQDSDTAVLLYTSGTTGRPKGAELTHHNLLNNGFSIGEVLKYTGDDRVVLPVPFFHCFGMVIGFLAIFSHGASAIIPSPGFDPEKSLAAAADEQATSLYGVPTMFIAELDHPRFADFDLSHLRTGVMAGSPCPVEVMKKVISKMNMSEVAICYGMTETSPVSTMTRTDDTLARRTETVGRVMPFVEVKIVDPITGLTLPRGQKGELCTRGYSVMRGYWKQPDKTAEAIDAGGWMHTGDLGIMDDDGYVDVSGRIKDMVIRGGENIYPREIEEFLYTHPSIADVQVVGVTDDKFGEELMAWVILREGVAGLTADDVREFSRGKLAHYKIPRYVEVRETFPMTVSGKVRKVELREEAERLTRG